MPADITSKRTISMPADITAMTVSIETLIPLELSRQKQIDECLSNDIGLTIQQLFQRLLTTTAFIHNHQLLEYVKIRSHLYDLDSEIMIIRRRSDEYRNMMLLLIALIDKSTMTVLVLHELMLRKFQINMRRLVDANNDLMTFEEFLLSHQAIFEISERHGDDEDRYILLRGTNVPEKNVLIPRFYTK